MNTRTAILLRLAQSSSSLCILSRDNMRMPISLLSMTFDPIRRMSGAAIPAIQAGGKAMKIAFQFVLLRTECMRTHRTQAQTEASLFRHKPRTPHMRVVENPALASRIPRRAEGVCQRAVMMRSRFEGGMTALGSRLS